MTVPPLGGQNTEMEPEFYFVPPNTGPKGWLGIEPVLAYDFEENDAALDWSLVAGKAWSNGVAIDLRWTRLDRIDPAALRDDELVFLGISYQFGAPPRGSTL